MKTLIIHFVFLAVACFLISGCTCAGDEDMEEQGFPNLPLLDDSTADDSSGPGADDSLQDDDSLADDSAPDDDSIDDDTSSDDTSDDTVSDDDSIDDDTSSDDTADDDDSIDDDTGDRLLEVVDMIQDDTNDYFTGPISLAIGLDNLLHASYEKYVVHYRIGAPEYCKQLDLKYASGQFGTWDTTVIETGECARDEHLAYWKYIGKSSNVILLPSQHSGPIPEVVYNTVRSYVYNPWPPFRGKGYDTSYCIKEGSIKLWEESAGSSFLFGDSIETESIYICPDYSRTGKGVSSFVDGEGNIIFSFAKHNVDDSNLSVAYATYFSDYLTPEYFDSCTDVSKTAVSMDLSGNVHVVYDCTVATSTDELRHASNETGEWVVQAVDSPSPGQTGVINQISRIVQSDGGLQLAYIFLDDDPDGILKFARYENGSWTKEVVDEGRYLTVSLALDDEGIAHIAYSRDQQGPLYIAKNPENSWIINTPDPSMVESTGDVDLAFDSFQNLHLLYITNVYVSGFIDTSTLWHMVLPSTWP